MNERNCHDCFWNYRCSSIQKESNLAFTCNDYQGRQMLMYYYDKINVGDIYEPKHRIERKSHKLGFLGNESVFACKITFTHEGKVIRHNDYYEEVNEGCLYSITGNPIDMHYDPLKIEKTYFVGVEYYGDDFKTISEDKIEIHEFLDNFKLNNNLFEEENNRRKKLNVYLSFLRLLYVMFIIAWYPIIFPIITLLITLSPIIFILTYIFTGECECVSMYWIWQLVDDFPKSLKPHEKFITLDKK